MDKTNSSWLKTFSIGFSIISFGITLAIVGYVLTTNKNQNVTQPSPTQKETSNWKTYTYKNISFQYPSNWVVVFDSTEAGQPNSFSLHVQDKNATGYQPDGLSLSTFYDRENLNGDNGYKLNPDRKFTKTDNAFFISGTPIYAGCAFYSEGQDTIQICNQILATFRFIE